MFKKNSTINLKPQRAYIDSCMSSFKRLKFHDDNGFFVCENDYDTFIIRHIDISGNEVKKWTAKASNGIISDYLYINNALYISFVNVVSEYEEIYTVYRSDNNGEMVQVFSCQRESYQHDMNYFSLFEYYGECRLLLIRHNRVHLYSIGSHVREINVIEGQKWYISNTYAICSMGRDWEIYNSSLDLITAFKFDEEVDWLEVVSPDNKLLLMATNNTSSEIGGLFIYDPSKDSFDIHYQRYGFYNAGICHGRVWATVGSMYSGIGGLMIFDKSAVLKFAHLRDENEGNTIRAYNPAPIIYQSSYIGELPDGKVIMLDYEKAVITDVTCRLLQEIKHDGYDCLALSEDTKKIAVLNLENRLLGGEPETEYNSSIDIYTWGSEPKKGSVIDLTSYRK